MQYIQATETDVTAIVDLIRQTIAMVYPRYYPQEVVHLFLQLHNEETVRNDVLQGNVWMLLVNGQLVGTGSQEQNHITRVYVLPDQQGRGYGSYIMEQLEQAICQDHPKAILESSLPAVKLYEKRGYQTVEHKQWFAENNAVLVYEIMEKPLVDPEMSFIDRI